MLLLVVVIYLTVRWIVNRFPTKQPIRLDRQFSPEEYISFGELPQVEGNPKIQQYIVASRTVYERHGMSIEDVKISGDLMRSQFSFSVDREDQANPRVMHGGLSYFIVDSVIAAHVMARFPNATPLTLKSDVSYKAPCQVGYRYTVKVEVVPDPSKPKIQTFAYILEEAGSEKVAMSGSMTYFPKVDHESDKIKMPTERWILHPFAGYIRWNSVDF